MASKQIGKFRQRVGEMVNRGQTKTTVTDDFKELEADVQLRGAGLERLTTVADAYIKSLAKKKEVETDADGKLKVLPCEALGVTMMGHGEEFGDQSVYGAALVSFGRVHCKIATIQEDYAVALRETYLTQLRDATTAIQEYQAQRKKLESRRLALDAFTAKLAKAKKEKEKAEAEEEFEIAKLRYEEMSEEVQDRMLSIQKREADQFAELTEFLDTEIAYVALYHDTLLQLRLDWPDPASANVKALTHRQSFIRDTEEPPPRGSLSSERDRPPPSPTRRRANTTTGSALPTLSHNRKRSDSLVTTETNGSAGSTPAGANGNGKADGKGENGTASAIKGKASGWMGTISRSRKNSSVSKKNFQSLGDDEEHEPIPPHSFSTTANITSTSNNTSSSRPRSASSANASAPSTASASLRMRKPPAPPVRAASTRSRPPSLTRLRALYDLVNVAPDELAFRAGDVVTVLDESFDPLTLSSDSSSWVRAEKDGFVGLVPMNYFEAVPASPRKAVARAPGLPNFGGANGYNASTDETDESDSPSSSLLHDAVVRQSASTLLGHKRGGSRGASKSTSFPDLHHQPQRNQNRYDSHDDDSASNNDYGYDDAELGEEEHVFGDKYSMTSPASTAPSSSLFANDSSAPSPRVRGGSSTLFPPPSHSSPHLTTGVGGRMSKTAPPSPVRPPAPPIPTASSSTSYSANSNPNANTNSPRQLPVSIANAVAAAAAAGKKPPPPPPPARRAQSSAYIGSGGGAANVNGSNSSFASGSSGGGAPPLLPPSRRPGLPVRPVTSTEGRSLGLSPFDA